MRTVAARTHNPPVVGSSPTRPTGRTIAQTMVSFVSVVSFSLGMGLRGPGILNTGMTPSSVMRISATRASMATLRSAGVPLVMVSAR